MTDISTKKTIEIWDGDTGLNFIVRPDEDGCNEISVCRRNGDGFVCMRIPVGMSGQLNRAIIEVAHNIVENTREDDEE